VLSISVLSALDGLNGMSEGYVGDLEEGLAFLMDDERVVGAMLTRQLIGWHIQSTLREYL
jgi:hypothetical protein